MARFGKSLAGVRKFSNWLLGFMDQIGSRQRKIAKRCKIANRNTKAYGLRYANRDTVILTSLHSSLNLFISHKKKTHTRNRTYGSQAHMACNGKEAHSLWYYYGIMSIQHSFSGGNIIIAFFFVNAPSNFLIDFSLLSLLPCVFLLHSAIFLLLFISYFTSFFCMQKELQQYYQYCIRLSVIAAFRAAAAAAASPT